MKKALTFTSVSWIEGSRLPHAGTMMALGGTPKVGSWANRVVMGLVATSNPTPGESVSARSFQAKKQYRALTHFELSPQSPTAPKNIQLDPGYTPPFEKSKVDTFLVNFARIPDAAKEFHAGDLSSLSKCVGGKLHPSSTLKIAAKAKVLASMLIKFRAGETTNNIGISDDVGSPVHVPWVWCEHALVNVNAQYFLIANGSKFPSHAWYINGKKIVTQLQAKIVVSEKEPAISTGRPKSRPRSTTNEDSAKGSVASQECVIQANEQVEIDISKYVS
jgi:hypothetical protein